MDSCLVRQLISKIISLSRSAQAFILVSLVPRLHPQTREKLAHLGAEPGSEAAVNGYICQRSYIQWDPNLHAMCQQYQQVYTQVIQFYPNTN